jgi:predicted porin
LTGSLYDGNDDRTIAAADERKLSGYQLGARYALSKRTTAYAVTGNNRNEGTGADNTAKVKTSAVGLIHSF